MLNMQVPKIEIASKETIKAFQEEKLVDLLNYLNQHSKFYHNHFTTYKINCKEIKSLEDLNRIPVTTKDDLHHYNDDFICVPPQKIIDYVTTSGTLGDPVSFALTDNDLERLAYNEAISFACAGCNESDIFQLMTTLDRRFMAGMAYFMGARKLGAGVIRVGAGIPELQWDTINRTHPTTLVCVPSFLLKMIDYAENHSIDYQHSSIKKAICIGEALRTTDFKLSKLAQRIKEKWDIALYSTYASTEMATAFTECSQGRGGHHHPELIIVEFLDENNQPVNEGEAGEVTVTTLGVEGMPLLRFKTGDICYHYTAPCACGRTTLRIGPIIGRRQQMIKYKGTTLYPPALYDILDQIVEVENYCVEVRTNTIGMDEIIIFAASKLAGEKLEKLIKDHFRARLRVAPEVCFVDNKKINTLQFPAMSRKPVKLIDNRKRK